MKIIYLHGFGSSGKSAKSDALKAVFGDDHVEAPNLPINPRSVVEMVQSIVKNNKDEPIVFVGTSLGGFYAHYFSTKFDAPCVLVNPSTEPHITMRERLGKSKNYATGEDFWVTEDFIDEWEAMATEIAFDQNGANIHLFLAADDDVLNPEVARKNIPYIKSLTVTEDGGHRYDLHWDKVIEAIKTIA
jgi:predicted esterase YcpF (UPF0227 family)